MRAGTRPTTNPPSHSKKPQLSDFERQLWHDAVVAALSRKDVFSAKDAAHLAAEVVYQYRLFVSNLA